MPIVAQDIPTRVLSEVEANKGEWTSMTILLLYTFCN